MRRSHRFDLALAAGLGLAVALAPTLAAAQEVDVTGPIQACIALLLLDATPAELEFIPWLSSGVRLAEDDDGWQPSQGFGIGGELTAGLARITGPSYGGPVELRWGPWAAAETDLENRFIGEGGVLLSAGQTEHPPFGSFTFRAGGGYGEQPGAGLGSHLSFTLTGGVHSLLDRYSERGACDPKPTPADVGFGSALRLFASVRAPVDDLQRPYLSFGVELSPGFLLPPYSIMRLAGGRPR